MTLASRYSTTIHDPMAPLDRCSRLERFNRFDRLDSLDFWDRLRHWRALDYFDAMIPSFFQPIIPSTSTCSPLPQSTSTSSSLSPRCHQIVRSKSMSQLNYCNEIVNKDGFKVHMDVHKFKPSQVEVRIVNDAIVIEGKQSENWDNHKTTTRSFAHRYTLPLGYDPWLVTAQLSSNGILTVRAPPPAKGLAKCLKRFVPIKHV